MWDRFMHGSARDDKPTTKGRNAQIEAQVETDVGGVLKSNFANIPIFFQNRDMGLKRALYGMVWHCMARGRTC